MKPKGESQYDDKPHNMNVVRDGKLYRTESATLLASGVHESRLSSLFRTSRGKYFVQYRSDSHSLFRDLGSAAEEDKLEPLTQDKAIEMFQTLEHTCVSSSLTLPFSTPDTAGG